MTLILLAGLQSRPGDVLEAANVDGANSWQTFRFITMPHMRRYLELGGLLGSIYVVQTFDTVYVMTAGSLGTANLPLHRLRNPLQRAGLRSCLRSRRGRGDLLDRDRHVPAAYRVHPVRGGLMTTAVAPAPSKSAAQRKKSSARGPQPRLHAAAISSQALPPGQSASSSSSRSSTWC